MKDGLRSLVARYEASYAALPDMTGLDFAYERGWIDTAEHDAAEAKCREHRALCVELLGEVDALRTAEPQAYEDALRDPAIASKIAVLERFRS